MVLWTLALLGCWQLAVFIWRWFSPRGSAPPANLLFIVKDNEETVESLFRQMALEWHWRQRRGPGEVLVFDLGSRDQTGDILRRLAQELGFFQLLRLEENQVGSALKELKWGTLLLDLRVAPLPEALVQVRRFLSMAAGS